MNKQEMLDLLDDKDIDSYVLKDIAKHNNADKDVFDKLMKHKNVYWGVLWEITYHKNADKDVFDKLINHKDVDDDVLWAISRRDDVTIDILNKIYLKDHTIKTKKLVIKKLTINTWDY